MRTHKTNHLKKTIQLLHISTAIIGFLMLMGCVADDDFDTPDTSISEPILEGPVISIGAVAGELAQAQGNTELDYEDDLTIYTYEFNTQPLYLTGYVVSSDEGGNFFEELVIQDQPENPSMGIKILLDVNPLSGRYEPGRKVYLLLNGLSVGITNGVLAVGLRNGNEVDQIPSAAESNILQRDPELVTLRPLPVEIADFTDDKTNLFVRLEDVQFNRALVLGPRPLSYASEEFDQFDGERLLESCSTPNTTTFSTSTFADFKSLSLPTGRGYIDAILTKDFFGEVFNVRVNSPEDVGLVNEERCDPDFLECETPAGGGSAVFFEDFQDFTDFEVEGWTNINVSNGDTNWTLGSFASNSYAQISGFNTNETNMDVWLITPPIDLDNTSGETLEFDIQSNFDNGRILKVFAAEDFNGDPVSATWVPLDVIIPMGPANGFGSFESIGPINVSCLNGQVHFGFFYEGSDPQATTRYHLDNIRITGME